MRFAKITEAIIERHDELTGEELRLYILIVFHTFLDTGLCRKTITELSRIHGLVRNHASERFKVLRQKGWCRKERGGIRPIVGFKGPEIGLSEVQKTDLKSPKSGLTESKKRSFETAKSPKNGLSPIPYIEPFKPEPLNTHTENGVRVNSNNGHKSIFSLEECIQYAEQCKAAGDDIKSPLALGKSIYESGEFDSRIQAKLYPETPAETPLDDERAGALRLLLDVKNSGEDVFEYKHWYSEEDWQWLMAQLAK